MKRIIILFVLLTSTLFYAQSSGITYQAVLYNPSGEILPGNNNTNAVLSNKDICLRFSITDAQTNLEYQETQKVKTDEFGMVNLLVGSGSQIGGYATNFSAIVWNSSSKKLQVEIDITGTCANFIEVSKQDFSAVPFAYASKTAENITGIVAITNGGTGSSTVSGAKTNLGLNNVDNTSDLIKPISTATQTALNFKEDSSNKSISVGLGTSDVLFPTQNAVKSYVDTQITTVTVSDASTTSKGKIQLGGDLAGTADAPTVPGLANKENVISAGTTSQYFRGDKSWQLLNKTVVGLANVDNTSDLIKPISTATQTALNFKEDSSNKSISVGLGTSDVLFPTQNAVKSYVDTQITTVTVSDASTTSKGKIQLGGDLAGTADAPTVPGLANKENVISAGTTSQYFRGDKSWQLLNKTVVGLANVDNTSDLIKPISTATQTALNFKEDSSNKSISVGLGTSDVLFPTQNAVKSYVDTQITTVTVSDASTTSKGKIQLGGDLAGTADAPTVPGLANKENVISAGTTSQYFRGDKSWQLLNKTVVGLANVDNTSDLIKPISTATQTALNFKEDSSNKSISVGLGTSDVLFPTQNAVKSYVDTQITTVTVSDASTTSKGKIQLGGDLAGTSSTATNPIISNAAITTLKIADNAVTNAKIGEVVSVNKGGSGADMSTTGGYLKQATIGANFSTVTSIPVADVAGAVHSVNGVLPAANGNVSVVIGQVTTGTNSDPTQVVVAPHNSDIYVVSGQTGTPNDNGRTFINDGINWHEIATNIASLENTFVKLSGSTMFGNLVFPTGKKITIADVPTGSTDVANKNYVDTKIGGTGTVNFISKFNSASLLENSNLFDNGTNVGIGTIAPTSKLEVNGAATNATALNSVASTTIDFSKSNLAYTTASAGAFILTNIKDGGTFTLAVQGANSGISTFTSTGFTFKYVNNGITSPNKHTLYTFLVMGTTVYVYMATGF